MNPKEKSVMEMTMKASFSRAADIIDGITEQDVLDMQAHLLATGSTVANVSKVDRAMLAATHFRAIAEGKA